MRALCSIPFSIHDSRPHHPRLQVGNFRESAPQLRDRLPLRARRVPRGAQEHLEARRMRALVRTPRVLGVVAVGQDQRLDARDLFFDRPEHFADPDHINRHGARELTQRIRSEFEALEASGA